MDVKSRVRQYIVDSILMVGDGAELGDRTSLLERNILDSTGVLELASFLEETFQIKVADHDLVPANLDTLDGIAAYVSRKRATAALVTPAAEGAVRPDA
jgi:acyl carrier protein